VDGEKTQANGTGNHAPARINKGCEEATIQAKADVTRGKELRAAAEAEREANFAISFRRVAGQPERGAQKRSQPSPAQLLQGSRLPVVDRHPPERCGKERPLRYEDARMLMGEQAFELKAVGDRHIHHAAERRCTVQVDRLSCDELEEVPTEPVACDRRDLDRLRRKDRSMARQACHDDHPGQSDLPACHDSHETGARAQAARVDALATFMADVRPVENGFHSACWVPRHHEEALIGTRIRRPPTPRAAHPD
jgi:hypothetical protein